MIADIHMLQIIRDRIVFERFRVQQLISRHGTKNSYNIIFIARSMERDRNIKTKTKNMIHVYQYICVKRTDLSSKMPKKNTE